MSAHTIRIEGGTLRYVHDDLLWALQSLGPTTITRASVVDYSNERRGWMADMRRSGGDILGPFPTRGAALWAERGWLAEHLGL